MSKKGTIEVFQTKISRNDRFAQMSHQEKLIEQKKKEIQAKLEQKQKITSTENTKSNTTVSVKSAKSPVKHQEKKPFNFNTFSNDGSFLNQFKQMKGKKNEKECKPKQFKWENHDRYSEDKNKSKWRREMLPRATRFSDIPPQTFEPKININNSYSNLFSQQNVDGQSVVTAQDVTGQPLLKNLVTQNMQFPLSPQNSSIIAAPPLLLNVPPPQIQLQNQMVLPSTSIEMVELCPTTVIATTTLPALATIPSQTQTIGSNDSSILNIPPPCMPNIELANIPPPKPIQVHNIPAPEPLNTLTIPPPAPLQVQNIPPPSPIHLNEIPNPKPLDILSIPTPSDPMDKTLTDPPDFIKNIPPPNKSVPPPKLAEQITTVPAKNLPPNPVPTCIPPPNIMPPTSMPPPQNILLNQPQTQSLIQQPIQQIHLQTLPPPMPQTQAVLPQTISIVNMPALQPNLMAQSIISQSPAIGIVPPPPINMNCPPPTIQAPNSMQVPPPSTSSFISQLPPTNNQQLYQIIEPQVAKEMNSGSADYEAMASLGRVVAQCGQGIEDIVRQRKNQDPSLWFLFHKESTTYKQYLQLVDQFKSEMKVKKSEDYRPEDIYEPEMLNISDFNLNNIINDKKSIKRKRKSRWGKKETELLSSPGLVVLPNQQSKVTKTLFTKIRRSDPSLEQYALNIFGSTNLSEENWKKAEDHFKINMLYQDMMRKRQEVERLKKSGMNKYDYDSDEDTVGGTWEHKLREKEMIATQLWATELTRQADGKHHIGDFLPPEEFKKMMEKSQAAKDGRLIDISDYKEFKLKEDNIGFKMLQKLGWTEGQGLGSEGSGILEPINKGGLRECNQGLGLEQPDNIATNDDEYDAYRKRMMLAYRFRPNPLNNPRRPYY